MFNSHCFPLIFFSSHLQILTPTHRPCVTPASLCLFVCFYLFAVVSPHFSRFDFTLIWIPKDVVWGAFSCLTVLVFFFFFMVRNWCVNFNPRAVKFAFPPPGLPPSLPLPLSPPSLSVSPSLLSSLPFLLLLFFFFFFFFTTIPLKFFVLLFS